MTEPIGEGCECIYSFEKHYANYALDNLITDIEKDISNTEAAIRVEVTPEIGEAMANVVKQYKRVLADVKQVRDRFEAMPKCD